jgi:hypothetical protein
MALWTVASATHLAWPEIITRLPDDFLLPALAYPGFGELLDVESIPDAALRVALRNRMAEPALFAAGKGS